MKNKISTYVITVSQTFPSYHPKCGKPTLFVQRISALSKIHTIRGSYALWEKRFKKINEGKAFLSVRIWTGKPYNSPQEEVFKFDSSHGIGLEKLENPNNFVFATIGNMRVDWGAIAENDGLSFEDFCNWFKVRTPEPMAIIHFTNFRYNFLTRY
jgi:hypothetical protein